MWIDSSVIKTSIISFDVLQLSIILIKYRCFNVMLIIFQVVEKLPFFFLKVNFKFLLLRLPDSGRRDLREVVDHFTPLFAISGYFHTFSECLFHGCSDLISISGKCSTSVSWSVYFPCTVTVLILSCIIMCPMNFITLFRIVVVNRSWIPSTCVNGRVGHLFCL